MNRRSFFKFLGIGTIASIVAPKVIAEAVKESSKASKNLPYYNALDCVMSGTPINMEPFTLKTYQEYVGYHEFVYTVPDTNPVSYYIADNPLSGIVGSYIWKNPNDPVIDMMHKRPEIMNFEFNGREHGQA